MKKIYVRELDKNQVFSLAGTRVHTIRRNGTEVKNENCSANWEESILVATECESIKVVIPTKGRWAPLVNKETRKPYGFVFKSKTAASIEIHIVAPIS